MSNIALQVPDKASTMNPKAFPENRGNVIALGDFANA